MGVVLLNAVNRNYVPLMSFETLSCLFLALTPSIQCWVSHLSTSVLLKKNGFPQMHLVPLHSQALIHGRSFPLWERLSPCIDTPCSVALVMAEQTGLLVKFLWSSLCQNLWGFTLQWGEGNGIPLQYSWKIPWMEECGGLQSMGSLRVSHDWTTSLSLFTFMHWRRKWKLTPVFLPGEFQGRGSLVGCCLWGRTESDTTEAT